MTRPEIQALYNRLLASPSEDGVNILADAFQRAQVDAAKVERERIARTLAEELTGVEWKRIAKVLEGEARHERDQ